jgi:hypothetical protein
MDMKTSRIALFAFAAIVGIGSLVGSAQYSPVSAGQLDWLSNDNYVRCLKYVSAISHGSDAAYDRGRRACNRQYYPGKPGYDY